MKKRLRRIVDSSFPGVIREGRKIKKSIRRRKLASRERNGDIVNKSQLITDLKKIGLGTGDLVMVHSSLRKIGFVEHGPQTVVEALLEVIGEDGTLVMPSFPSQEMSYKYLEKNPVFDIRTTPSKMGAITEYFRNLKEVRRSFHPTDPVIAKGLHASYLTKDHFGALTPYSADSPFNRLFELKGKILMIGVNTEYCTTLHAVEDAIDFKYPVYMQKEYCVKMIDENGNEHTMKTKAHNPRMAKERKPVPLEALMEKEGVLQFGKVGEADSMLISAEGARDFLIKGHNEKGVTVYTPFGEEIEL